MIINQRDYFHGGHRRFMRFSFIVGHNNYFSSIRTPSSDELREIQSTFKHHLFLFAVLEGVAQDAFKCALFPN